MVEDEQDGGSGRRTRRPGTREPGRGGRAGDERSLDLGAFLRDRRLAARLSLRGLSEASGISNPYLSQIERGLRRPSADVLRQLAGALDVAPEALYVRAGILEPTTSRSDLAAAIRRDGELSEPQKRTLLHVYEALRAERARQLRGLDDHDGESPRATGS